MKSNIFQFLRDELCILSTAAALVQYSKVTTCGVGESIRKAEQAEMNSADVNIPAQGTVKLKTDKTLPFHYLQSNLVQNNQPINVRSLVKLSKRTQFTLPNIEVD